MIGQDVETLLDAAKKQTGSDYKTAQQIHVPRMQLSNWRHGKPMPAADVALVAMLAGLDAEAWTLRAVAQTHEGTAKGDKLQKALKKALAATGAVIVSSGARAALITATATDYFIRCILC